MPTAAHFLYIPAVLLLGIVIGWILGSRAAADAYAMALRRQSQKTQPPGNRVAESPITNHGDSETQRRSSST
jgi:hypothetical protein